MKSNYALTIVCGISIGLVFWFGCHNNSKAAFGFCSVSLYCIYLRVLLEARDNAKFRWLFQKALSQAIEKKYGHGVEHKASDDAEAKGH